MIIAVNTHSIFSNSAEANSRFLFTFFSAIAKNHPEHDFIFITNKKSAQEYDLSKNCRHILISSKTSTPLLWHFWYNYRLSSAVRKYKADVLVTTYACSLRTKISQCLIIPDLGLLQYPQFFKVSHLRFFQKNIIAFLNKAKSIITFTASAKQAIIDQYAITENNIDICNNSTTELYQPIDWKQKELIKEKYTSGKEYFLYTGEINEEKNLINLLKAFSKFKKMQKSNMQLVLAGKIASGYISFSNDLKTYKHKGEVILLENLKEEELAAIIASAYTVIFPFYFDMFYTTIFKALQSEVPVIGSYTSALNDICGEAALYIDPNNIDDIANKMMLIFKNEDERNVLIETGKQQTKQYNTTKTADLLWRSILKTTKQ